MPLMIVLNAILCLAITVMVVSPLVWAILTQHRDETAPQGTAVSLSRPRAHRARRTWQTSVAWPAR
jgi:hypothetical protein